MVENGGSKGSHDYWKAILYRIMDRHLNLVLWYCGIVVSASYTSFLIWLFLTSPASYRYLPPAQFPFF